MLKDFDSEKHPLRIKSVKLKMMTMIQMCIYPTDSRSKPLNKSIGGPPFHPLIHHVWTNLYWISLDINLKWA